MKLSKIFIAVVILFIAVAAGWWIFKKVKPGETEQIEERDIIVTNGSVNVTVRTTANVEPQNRLEVKPPTAGRIEELLVKEGDKVKSGQIIGWISSTERAALLDAAMAHGAKELAYWKEVYKPAALTAPIDGEVIVRDFEPGQSITVASAVIVLSDRLIVMAQVDETDIGKVKVGQDAEITLDAYPEVKTMGKIDHISYESKLVNNVTIYAVDILPERVPDIFRSGMSATVTIICGTRVEVPVITSEAVSTDKDGTYVLMRPVPGGKSERRKVVVGVADEQGYEIKEGLRAGDVLVVAKKRYRLPSKDGGANPLMPFAKKKEKEKEKEKDRK
ncbi:MAG: efflux RND transporter periplasmic adaptor subunit [Kiritimatiellae bacterium]|nr:efflux RND transporter periplasmic adaptor subunit [Kiritimatiellia bacterium]MDD5521504.1 efflux RND transporter periplasmic adaptor subunit [Kiritimatiellia bacterium]